MHVVVVGLSFGDQITVHVMLKEPRKASVIKMVSQSNKQTSFSELEQSVDTPDRTILFSKCAMDTIQHNPNARDNSLHVDTSYVSTTGMVVGLTLLVGLALPHVTRPLDIKKLFSSVSFPHCYCESDSKIHFKCLILQNIVSVVLYLPTLKLSGAPEIGSE